MITKTLAEKLAVEFVRNQFNRELPFIDARYDNDPCQALRKKGIVFGKESDLCRPCWTVSFQTLVGDGKLMDDPTLVIVDAESGNAAFFEDIWEKARQSAT